MCSHYYKTRGIYVHAALYFVLKVKSLRHIHLAVLQFRDMLQICVLFSGFVKRSLITCKSWLQLLRAFWYVHNAQHVNKSAETNRSVDTLEFTNLL